MDKIQIIRTNYDFGLLRVYLDDKDLLSFDTETTSVDSDAEVIGFSVGVNVGDNYEGYYVVLSYWDVQKQALQYLDTNDLAKDFFCFLQSKQLVMQNAVFDCRIVKSRYNIDLMPSLLADTLIMGHLLNENRFNGLKERGVELYGEDARQEQLEMKESVAKNGGVLTKKLYELYKADSELIARYGAKDAILTLKILFNDLPILEQENLVPFYFGEESMPLLKGPTYDLNTVGLRVDSKKIQELRSALEVDILQAKDFIYKEIEAHVNKEYPSTSKAKTFNIGSSKQLSWLLFFKLNNEFHILTKAGRELCKYLDLQVPYNRAAKTAFIQEVIARKGDTWTDGKINKKTKKLNKLKKIGDPWTYIACGKETLQKYANKYKWVARFLEFSKNTKLLNTYVVGIQERMKYNVIHPSFLQHGTTSGRFSSRNPNFQNLPRDDKRIKSCIIAREGKVFVGADYSQLEPRVFASFSQDEALLKCFESGEDFYSIIGAKTFNISGVSLHKNAPNSFAEKYPELRQIAKTIGLSVTYGTTAYKLAQVLNKSTDECQEIVDTYLFTFPGVKKLMNSSHKQVKETGKVFSLFNRPRRIPEATQINLLYRNQDHSELPYNVRNMLNLATNHRIQSTASSIVNRASIRFYELLKEHKIKNCHMVLQVHDEIIAECDNKDAKRVAALLKKAMETSSTLPGVALVAEPKIANNLADLK